MKDDFSLFNIRFIIPPVITIFTVLGLLLASGYWSEIIIFLSLINDVGSGLISIMGASVLLLTLGFTISTIAIIIITCAKWDATNFETIGSENNQERNIKEVYVWGNLLMRGAEILDIESRQYIEKKLEKRLHMSSINFNSFIGIIIGLIIYIFIFIDIDINKTINWTDLHLFIAPIIIIIFAILFYLNAHNTRRSHHLLKRILMVIDREDLRCDNYETFKEKIKEKLENQKIKNSLN